MRIGFVGAGNMAGAIARGVVASGVVQAQDVVVTSRTPTSRARLAEELGARTAEDAAAVVAEVDVVVLAVKPHQLPEVLAPLREGLARHRPLVVSVAAGTRLHQLAALAPGTALVRAMPNVNTRIGAGVTALCATDETSPEQRRVVAGIFEAVGSVVEIDEALFPAFTAVAGSGPAFTALFVEALALAGVRNGLPKAQAVEVAAQTVLGSARTVLDGTTPPRLADLVSSPGGTTIAGRCAMEDAGFSAAVVRGVQAAVDRDRELGAPASDDR